MASARPIADWFRFPLYTREDCHRGNASPKDQEFSFAFLVVARYFHERNRLVWAIAAVNRAMELDLANSEADTFRDELRAKLDRLFICASDEAANPGNACTAATQRLRDAGVGTGYVVVADGTILAAFDLCDDGRTAAFQFAEYMASDEDARFAEDDQFSVDSIDFTMRVYECSEHVRLLQEFLPD